MTEPTPTHLQPEIFKSLPGVVAGFSTRHGGASEAPFAALNLSLSAGDQRMHVLENRRRLAASVGFSPDRLALAGQVHGAAVQEVDAPGFYPETDGLVTRMPGILLCISAADCAAVLLADPEHRVVGACHAGWRGTVARIVPRTIDRMEDLGARAARMVAYISPCISLENFEVGPEVAARFEPAFVRHLPGQEKPHVDLKAALAAQLQDAGVPADRIEVSPHCTFGQTGDFFSHRAEAGRTGRMMGFIGLRAQEG